MEKINDKRVATLQEECDYFKDQLRNREHTLKLIEEERAELQGCLDKTRTELAKADQELRQSSNVTVKPLQHLYKWITARYDTQEANEVSADADILVQQIKSVIESTESNKSPRASREQEQVQLSARDKRDFAQQKIQQMLSKASSRYGAGQIDNGASTSVQNEGLLRDQNRNGEIDQLERKLQDFSDQVIRAEKEIQKMQQEASDKISNDLSSYDKTLQSRIEGLERQLSQKRGTEQELIIVKKELEKKTEAEQILNDTLAEALGLIKPMKFHLDTAEKKKKALAKELKRAKKTIAQLAFDSQ